MSEVLVKKSTAELAKAKGFPQRGSSECWVKLLNGKVMPNRDTTDCLEHDRASFFLAQPSLAALHKWIREIRGVHIGIDRNASGWFWEMCKVDGGTNLGWSDYCGPNMGGVWDSYEEALEFGMRVQLSKDLEKGVHWGLYAGLALEEYKKIMKSKPKK